MTTAIRPAVPDDLPALLNLIQSAYRGDSSRGGWTHEADLIAGQRTDLATLAGILADPSHLLLIASDDAGHVMGCVELTDLGDGRCYLGLLSVDPTLQSRGLGKQLITAAEADARTRFGAGHMEMTVIGQRSELIAYYQRRGYGLTGEERPFPYEDGRFGTPKRDDLAFVVLTRALP